VEAVAQVFRAVAVGVPLVEGGVVVVVVVVAAVAGSTAAEEVVADSRIVVAVAAGNRNQVAAAGGLADAGSCRSSAGVAGSSCPAAAGIEAAAARRSLHDCIPGNRTCQGVKELKSSNGFSGR